MDSWVKNQRSVVYTHSVTIGQGRWIDQPAGGSERIRSAPGLPLVEMNNVLLLKAATLAADLGLRGADLVYVATAKKIRSTARHL